MHCNVVQIPPAALLKMTDKDRFATVIAITSGLFFRAGPCKLLRGGKFRSAAFAGQYFKGAPPDLARAFFVFIRDFPRGADLGAQAAIGAGVQVRVGKYVYPGWHIPGAMRAGGGKRIFTGLRFMQGLQAEGGELFPVVGVRASGRNMRGG